MESSNSAAELFSASESPPRARRVKSPLAALGDGIAILASLKLTVTLLVMAIFLVFVGTLAQDEEDMWQVIHNYFRGVLTWVEFEVFFPKAWFPTWQGNIPPQIPGDLGDYVQLPKGFWFPGGLSVGLVMAVNLIAAHALRFKVQTRSLVQLLIGLAVIGVGTAITCLVIMSGHNSGGLQGVPTIGWDGVWYTIKGGLFVAWLGAAAGAVLLFYQQGVERPWPWLLAVAAVGLTVLDGWLLYKGDAAKLSEPSLRILWQLAQGGASGLILLAGCALIFRQRAGIVLLHAGVGLMMFNELYVGQFSIEERMHIEEGQIINFARDIRAVELAVVDTSDEKTDRMLAIPKSKLKIESKFNDERLPFNIELLKYYRNADLRDLKEGEEPEATQGKGLKMAVDEVRSGSGADTDSAVDMAAALVRLTEKTGGGDLGTYLLTQILSEQDLAEKVTVDGKTYDVYLRFKRNYKPYTVRLLDVSKRDYIGTATPRDYSSHVHLVDQQEGRNFDRDDIRIWMNNPLRYAGETFYQSGYNRGRNGVESTDLQVVTNTGWMIPYVACMLVATGLLCQFSLSLWRFVAKLPSWLRARVLSAMGGEISVASPPASLIPTAYDNSPLRVAGLVVPIVIVLLCGFWMVSKARSPRLPEDGYDIHAFGRLPLVYQGRVKPFDTLARNSLRIISDREDFLDDKDRRQPAIRWLLDLVSEVKTSVRDRETGEDLQVPRVLLHKVVRIENPEVLSTLKLKRRPGYRYSIYEMLPEMEAFEEQARQANKLKPEDLSVYQKKVLELDRKIRTFTLLRASFRTLDLPAMPSEAEFEKDQQEAMRRFMAIRDGLQQIPQIDGMLAQMLPPLAVPVPTTFRAAGEPGAPPEKWLPYAKAWHEVARNRFMAILQGKPEPPANPAADMLHNVIDAYAAKNSGAFNREVEKYQNWLAKELPKDRLVVTEADKRNARAAAKSDSKDKTVAAKRAHDDDDPAYLNFTKVGRETFFNSFAPFYHATILYLIAFVFAKLSMFAMALGWSLPFRRTAFWLIVFTVLLHTWALGERIAISGRPPVTNLYSSAVFIGWGAVLLGIAFESIFRLGLGNIIASVAGFNTLIIAHNLAGDGDTFTVLQAVLDTQFWLATHVTCVTLGYATTFVAGGLGCIYIILGIFSPALRFEVGTLMGYGSSQASRQENPYLKESAGRIIGWMIYGSLCFALFFSFVGTVLGGLWADDSWGRFWGWDPKENGALIIVLWNAVILHARWGGMVKDRGMAVLALVGNIVTSWSWFGVNELGIGLHSYGFTEGVLFRLGLVVLLHLFLIGMGMLPKILWWSFNTSLPDDPLGKKEVPMPAEVL